VYPVHELVTIGETETRRIATACTQATIGCGICKNELVDNIAKVLEPFQAKRAELDQQVDYIKEVIIEGGKRARIIIKETVEKVRDKMGIVIY
jgi:tryptophanyl-tRNA synthetase